MRKPAFRLCKNKGADQLCSAFVFATRKVQFLLFLNLKPSSVTALSALSKTPNTSYVTAQIMFKLLPTLVLSSGLLKSYPGATNR